MTPVDRSRPPRGPRIALIVAAAATGALAAVLLGVSVTNVAASANGRADLSTGDLTAAISPAPVIPPVAGVPVNEQFGAKGPYWKVAHSGLDFEVANGVPVQAVVEGHVASVSVHRAYGKVVRLVRADKVEIWFCHLSSVAVTPGQHVKQGSLLGLSGATGNVSGPHLHVEVRVNKLPTDPAAFFFATPGVPGTSPAWAKPYWENPIAGYSAFKSVKGKLKYWPHAPIH